MIDKKIITPGALDIFRRIMRTCPATALNGGEHAKKHLHDLCEKGENITGCQLREGIDKTVLCNCEGEMDVCTHLLSSTDATEIDEREIMRYFGGNIHAEKIFADTQKDKFPLGYSLKVVYGHLLIAVTINDIENGIAFDGAGVVIKNLLKLSDDKHDYTNGDVVLVHYGFYVGMASKKDVEFLKEMNSKSPLYLESRDELGGKMDFATMHYFPRSRKMAGK